MPMNPELKKQWIAKLRSREFRQAEASLKTTDLEGNKSYCCLGVLCTMLPGLQEHPQDFQLLSYRHGYDHNVVPVSKDEAVDRNDFDAVLMSGYLREIVLDEIGLSFHHMKILANMNDSGQTFKQIADYIEKNADI